MNRDLNARHRWNAIMTPRSPEALLLAAALCVALPARAQDPRSVEVHQRNDCRQAHQILTLGQPANQRAWALRVIGNCGAEGGRALAAVLTAHQNDAVPSDEFERVVAAAALVVDSTLYYRALAIASDPGAGVAARVESIRILYHLLNPASFAPYRMFVQPPTGPVHDVPMSSTIGDSQGDPLPSNAYQQVASAMERVLSSPGVPIDVHRSASVLRLSAEYEVLKRRLCPAAASDAECEDIVESWYRQNRSP